MRRIVCGIAIALSVAGSRNANAQGSATMHVKVDPVGAGSNQARRNFAVCFGTTSNRALYGSTTTSGGGTANMTLSGVTSGSQVVVTISKSGFAGMERTITASNSNHVEFAPAAGSGGPACPANAGGAGASSAGTATSITPPPPPPPANDANIDVTVVPRYYAGQPVPSNAGFIVCIGFANDRAHWGIDTTGSSGVVNEKWINLPTGVSRVVTVQKAGYAGVEQTITTRSGWNNHVRLGIAPGSGGPSCTGASTPAVLAPPPSTTAPPATSTPPAAPAPPTRTLTVTVLDGTRPAAGAYVCVGAGVSAPERYARTRQTNSNGVVTFSGLPQDNIWGIIAGRSGKRAVAAIGAPHRRDTSITMAITTGTSPLCPGTPPPPPTVETRETGTAILPVAPDPARLGEEALAFHGDPFGSPGNNGSKYTCNRFGSNFVLVGLKVSHNVLTLTNLDMFCAPLLANGTLGPAIFLPITAATGANVAQAVCPFGQAVTGVEGTTTTQLEIRSLTLQCRPLMTNGLATGAATKLTPLGITSGSRWGPDLCTQNRPARAVNIYMNALGGGEMWSFLMYCEQPTRAQR